MPVASMQAASAFAIIQLQHKAGVISQSCSVAKSATPHASPYACRLYAGAFRFCNHQLLPPPPPPGDTTSAGEEPPPPPKPPPPPNPPPAPKEAGKKIMPRPLPLLPQPRSAATTSTATAAHKTVQQINDDENNYWRRDAKAIAALTGESIHFGNFPVPAIFGCDFIVIGFICFP